MESLRGNRAVDVKQRSRGMIIIHPITLSSSSLHQFGQHVFDLVLVLFERVELLIHFLLLSVHSLFDGHLHCCHRFFGFRLLRLEAVFDLRLTLLDSVEPFLQSPDLLSEDLSLVSR